MDLLYLPGVSGYLAPTVHGDENWRGRVHHISLFVCSRHVPRPLHPQLGVQILLRGYVLNCAWEPCVL